jgi:hypothetical protein
MAQRKNSTAQGTKKNRITARVKMLKTAVTPARRNKDRTEY